MRAAPQEQADESASRLEQPRSARLQGREWVAQQVSAAEVPQRDHAPLEAQRLELVCSAEQQRAQASQALEPSLQEHWLAQVRALVPRPVASLPLLAEAQ